MFLLSIESSLCQQTDRIEFVKNEFIHGISSQDDKKLNSLTFYISEHWTQEEIDKLGLAHSTSKYESLLEKVMHDDEDLGDFLYIIWGSIQSNDLVSHHENKKKLIFIFQTNLYK